MKILVTGLTKTGTSALFYLIANSVGNSAELLFQPKKCPKNLDHDKTMVIAKVMIAPSSDLESFSSFDKKITIVRDPRDRIISSLLYYQFHGRYIVQDKGRISDVINLFKEKESNPSKISIREIVERLSIIRRDTEWSKDVFGVNITKSQSRLYDYIENIKDGTHYKYEDFVLGKYDQLEDYLGLKLGSSTKLPTNLRRVERTKNSGDWRNWFTQEDIAYCQPILETWLEKFGYKSNDWTLNKSPIISPEHCSLYVAQLLEERRKKLKSM